mgnify:CR=1 FL=1
MLRRTLACALLLGSLLLPVSAISDNPLKEMYRGEGLYALLQSENAFLKYYAMGYITGVSFVYDDFDIICIDKDTIDQNILSQKVLKFLKNHPEERDQLSSIVIKESLKDDFPCP